MCESHIPKDGRQLVFHLDATVEAMRYRFGHTDA
jgi:hypothetical protein